MRPLHVGSMVSLAALGLAAWAYTAWMAATMADVGAMEGMAMPMSTDPGIAMLAAMWVVMMVAMMAPASAPSFVLYLRMDRASGSAGALHAGGYLGGYLGSWSVFALAAAAAQYGLHRWMLMSGDMALASRAAAGAVLIAAGAYQWSPLKARCVARCRSPLGFLLNEWRSGSRGALILGWRYGLLCVGCCWLLMCVMFVVGAMNLAWALALSGYVLLERLLPLGRWLDRAVGIGLAVWGAWLIVGPTQG